MTAVSVTYILISNEGFRLGKTVSYIVGAAAAVVLFAVYLAMLVRKKNAN